MHSEPDKDDLGFTLVSTLGCIIFGLADGSDRCHFFSQQKLNWLVLGYCGQSMEICAQLKAHLKYFIQ
jgi:hypothetical protein